MWIFAKVDEKDVHEFVERGSPPSGRGGSEDHGEDDYFAEPNIIGSNWPAVDVWYECVDADGNVYYYNENTKQSEWVAPEWVEETDEQSGAR